jgi:6-phospho-3-hexuloisomerase
MRGFAMRLMHLGLAVYVVDDPTTPAIAAGDLLLIGSGSGHSPSLVGYATRAKALQVQIGLITAAESSPVGDHADVIVRIRALTSKLVRSDETGSFQPMGNLFEQSLGLTLDLMTIQLMEVLNLTSEQMFARHANLE